MTTLTHSNPTLTPFTLDADGRSLLESVTRLLVRLQQPSLMARVQLEGYTTEEHRIGWQLLVDAGGGNTSVDLNVASGALQLADATVTQRRMSRLQQLDALENTWFPRVRFIIRRVLGDAPAAAAFEEAFFDELEQQPLGPGVVASMAKFVARVQSLDTTPGTPGASVRAVLSARGLTDERLTEVSRMVAELQSLDAVGVAVSESTASRIAAAGARRAASLAELERWYNDWATTFRSVFSTREQLQLGLTDLKSRGRGRKGQDEDDAASPSSGAPERVPAR